MKLSPRAALRLCTYLPFLVACVFAIPLTDNQTFFEPGSAQTDSAGNVQPRQSTDKPFYLRIQPLGASITYGYGTNPENGYRKPLRDQLRWRGWPINMVGSQSSGDPVNFKDRQHEGHKGWYVANMTMAANLSLDQKPNLILINCGTNDANPDNHQDVARTGARMKAVLNHLYDSVDGVTIILSTLVPYKQEEANDNVDLINVQYRSLVERLSGEGRKIVLAEMNNGFLDTSTDYFDAIHPNEKGAAKMAAVWAQAILIAEEQGFLTAPIDTDVPDTSTSRCDVEKGQARGPVQTQQGWGYSDGEYKHRETRTGPIAPTQSYSSDHFPEVYFAQLVNAGGADPPFAQDELILCYDNDADFDGPPSTCTMQLNDGSGDFNYSPKIYLELGLDCLTRGIRWGDVNGDGLDDFICINQAGNMYVAINRGDNPPRFEALENGGLIREGYSWAKQDRIRLGDIDGDGRLDYCALDDTGDIFCWRNGGVGDAPTDRYNGYWQSIVENNNTFPSQHEENGIAGVNLVDINGDGRADWVYLYPGGSSQIFINQRGDRDHDGGGIRPHWEWVYLGHEQVVGSEGRTDIVFGQIKGSGRADRVWARKGEPSGSGGAFTSLELTLFENQGSGGTKLKGDGVFYCDMFGRGYEDYLWVRSNGEITLFENLQSPPDWGVHGLIIDINRDRKSIHFGDWDGDGLCDILSVERHTGQVEMWRNTYKEGDKSPTFASPVFVPPLGPACTLGWGLGLHDRAVRFGDLDGDGRVDYICMKPDGESSAILNTASGYKDLGQIKFAPKGNFDRANFRWADVTGDGRVDLIWVNKFNGEARVWKNGGLIPAAGSSMTWISQGTRFSGHGRGENIHFPKLGANGRADYHDVYPATAIANTWFNECPGGLDDYEGPYPDPNLPPIVIGPPLPDPDDSENEQLFEEALAMSNYDISQFETYNLSDLATRLIGFDRCDRFQKREIYSGWQQSWKIMNLIKTEADNGINFNEGAAIEFLGAPAETRDLQAKFTAAFKQFSTIQPGWGGWFAWKLAVRCDDFLKECPCVIDTGTIAYTVNNDPKYDVPSINFCGRYFDFDTLDNKVNTYAHPDTLPASKWANLNTYYLNQARVWVHELFHVDWASLNGNPHITDLKIGWFTNPPHKKWVYVYGSQSTKALARLGRGWTQYNSDNYAMYTLARYVQKALGNIYPHLPLSAEVPDDVSPLYVGGYDIYQNGTGVLVNADDDSFSEWDVNDSECAALGDVPAATEASAFVTATGFLVQSDYPADYLSSWSSWAAEATAQL